MTAAYILATLILCSALIFSYFTLKNILTEQSRLNAFGSTTAELRTTIRDSTIYLSDLKVAKELPKSESRLEFKIEARLQTAVEEIQYLTKKTSLQLDELEEYTYYDDFNSMFNSAPDNIWIKLDQYIDRLIEVTNDHGYSAPGSELLWLPVEATAAKYGALGKSYESAVIRLQTIISERSAHLGSTHKSLTLLSLAIIALEISLIFLPLRKRLSKVNRNLVSAHKNLYVQANYDEQTGLPNTSGVLKTLQMSNAEKRYSCLSVISLENADSISRIVGPTALDIFFNEFVKQINQISSEANLVFRAGDSEFGILQVNDEDISNPESVRRLKNLLNRRLSVNNSVVHPKIRVGYTCTNITVDSFLNALIDARLSAQHYNHAENIIPRYEPLMRSSIEEENLLVEKIRVGLANHEFVPFYQIKVDAITGRACGMEALCRWKCSDGTTLSPFKFIPVAEKSGLITEITWQLLEQITNDYNAWIEQGLQPGRIAFNAADIFLRESDFSSRITDLVNLTTKSSCHLDLEITENVALGNDNEVIFNAIATARQLGMGIALDDFGTGYASLSSIVGLDVDIIKVDQSFVKMMSESDESKIIVQTLIYMCKQLNKKCVVEGVETKEEWEFCRDLGCDEIQGYFFHKPASFLDVLSVLAQEQSLKKAG